MTFLYILVSYVPLVRNPVLRWSMKIDFVSIFGFPLKVFLVYTTVIWHFITYNIYVSTDIILLTYD